MPDVVVEGRAGASRLLGLLDSFGCDVYAAGVPAPADMSSRLKYED